MEKFSKYLEHANLDSRPHQEKGVKWLLEREKDGILCNTDKVFGGFLADEMGTFA